jgi:uncharacterized 2Fe-2S/4Fe-4S cluster protein (DUF4445 family)
MFDLRLMNNQMESISIKEDRDLLSSLRSAGQDPICDCSGNGMCGKCKARIVMGNLTGITEVEKELLTPAELSSGWFLMCQRKPLDDLIIDMPKRDSVNIVLQEEPILDDFSPKVKKSILNFNQIDNGAFEDYKSLLLDSFAQYGVQSIAHSALKQLMPAIDKGNGIVTVVYSDEILSVEAGDTTDVYYAVACDLGTATVGLEIIDMVNKKILGKAFAGNSQRSFGYDMNQRVSYIKKHAEDCSELTEVLLYTINSLLSELYQRLNIDSKNIYNVEFSGNLQIIHLLLGIAPMQSEENPVFLEMTDKKGKEVGLHINDMARVSVVPAISGQFGGDITAVSQMVDDKKVLIVDIGIDTKLILKLDGALKLKSISTPVFEGMGLYNGMINGSGAIRGLYFDDQSQNVFPQLYDSFSAKGISGSGFFDFYCDMKKMNYLTDDNKFNVAVMEENVRNRVKETFVGKQMIVAGGGFMKVVITEKDIADFLSTVNNLNTEIGNFIKDSGDSGIDKVIVTGAVGAEFSIDSLKQLNIFPQELNDKTIEYLPELALKGAVKRLVRG